MVISHSFWYVYQRVSIGISMEYINQVEQVELKHQFPNLCFFFFQAKVGPGGGRPSSFVFPLEASRDLQRRGCVAQRIWVVWPRSVGKRSCSRRSSLRENDKKLTLNNYEQLALGLVAAIYPRFWLMISWGVVLPSLHQKYNALPQYQLEGTRGSQFPSNLDLDHGAWIQNEASQQEALLLRSWA